MTTLAEEAESLAQRHARQEAAEVDENRSLVNYAEAPRTGDWSLRSALVRLAQPHPLRAEAILVLVRRLDAALGPLTRDIQRHPVVTERSLPVDRGSVPITDGRSAALAILMHGRSDSPAEVIDGYERVTELSGPEKQAVPLLDAAIVFDRLADRLARWAAHGPNDPPVSEIDRACADVLERLDALGVPSESRPPMRTSRSRR